MAQHSRPQDGSMLFVLPKDTSRLARVVTLSNPRTLTPKRYFFCPEKGLYEFTRLATPRTAPRSCLIAPANVDKGHHNQLLPGPNGPAQDLAGLHQDFKTSTSSRIPDGHVVESPEFLIATPIDPLFLLLPVLCPMSSAAKAGPRTQLFLSAEDLFDTLSDTSKHFSYLVDHTSTRAYLEERLAAVCDSVAVADETMYRLSNGRLVKELIAKGQAMVKRGLPGTLEARFVRKALEVPVMNVKREESSLSAIASVGPEEEVVISQAGTQTPSESTDSRTSTSTLATLVSDASSSTTISLSSESPPIPAPEGIPQLLRLRTALSYILASYVPQYLSASLQGDLSAQFGSVNFTPLEQHLSHLSSLRSEVLASRSLSDFSRKRGMNEDGLESETRAEKKRKKEEDEKRKNAGQSRGVRDLKKVDTSGMKKMSDFFGKGSIQNQTKTK